jgi:tetratricopeptide (TPR) repeat protein
MPIQRYKHIKNHLTYLFFLLLIFSSCKTIKKTEKLSDEEKMTNTSLLIDANKEKILGNYKDAADLYAKCIKNDHSNATAIYELARIFALQEKYKDALILAKKSVVINPDNVWYQLLLADILKKNNQYDDVIKVYSNLIKKYPEKVEYYIELASAYIYINKYKNAIKIYNTIENKIGITEGISLQKKQIYLFFKKKNKAIEEINNLISKFPDNTKYYNIAADIYLADKQFDKALEMHNKILEIDPNNSLVHLSLADYYRTTGEKEKSYKELKIAFKNRNLDIDTKIKILLSYYIITEKYPELKEQADTLLKILIKVHPDEPKAHSMYADFLYRDKKLNKARNELHKTITLDNSKYEVWQQLLLIESELKDFDLMAKESKQAIELFPEQPVLYLLNGMANYQLKNYAKSISTLNKGIKTIVDNKKLLIEFYSYLGDINYKNKNNNASDSAYEKVLELDSNNSYVLNNYSFYLSLRNENLEKAEKMAEKAVLLSPNSSSYLDTYGWVLYKMNKLKQAKKWMNKALENGGDKSSVILEHYGDILYKMSETQKSAEYWQKAKNIGKGSKYLDKKIKDKKLYE